MQEEIFQINTSLNCRFGKQIKKSWKLSLFKDTLVEMKKKILKILKISFSNIDDFVFSIPFQGVDNFIYNEEDFYFIIQELLINQSDNQIKLHINIDLLKQNRQVYNLKGEIVNSNQNNDPQKLQRPSDKIYKGQKQVYCEFCKSSSFDTQLIEDLGPIYGPFKHKTQKYYFHELCAIWSPQVYLNNQNKLQNIIIEIQRSNTQKCTICKKFGAGLGCKLQNCKNTYHYKCSIQDNSQCGLNFDEFTLYCPDHIDLLSDSHFYENITCLFCLSGDDDSKLILCDECDNGFHIYCLQTKLDEIPQEEWFCDKYYNAISKIFYEKAVILNIHYQLC